MKTRATVALAVAALFLAGCSSTNSDVSDDAFCDAISEWENLLASAEESLTWLMVATSDTFYEGSEPTSDEINLVGQEIIDTASGMDAAIDIAVANTADSGVAGELVKVNSLVVGLMLIMGEAAKGADSAMDYTMVISASADRSAQLGAEFAELSEGYEVGDYVDTTCPDLIPGIGGSSERAYDTSARADVSTLGKEIAFYYIDGTGAPVITVVDGQYYLDDTLIGDVYEGNSLTGQNIVSATDWCVEVTNAFGAIKTFKYSSQDGLEEGTCS